MTLTAVQIAQLNKMNTAAQRAELGTWMSGIEDGNIASLTVTGTVSQSNTVSTNAMSTVRGVYGKMTGSGSAIASGNLVGTRGEVILSGTNSAGGIYLYGAQGKLAVTGTMNHADSRLCASLAQLDISVGTYTTGQLSALWVDAGASASATAVSTKGGGQFNLVRITNTTTANANSVIYAYAEADYLMDLGGPGGNADWFDAGTGASASVSGHLKVNLNGTPAYIRVYASAS